MVSNEQGLRDVRVASFIHDRHIVVAAEQNAENENLNLIATIACVDGKTETFVLSPSTDGRFIVEAKTVSPKFSNVYVASIDELKAKGIPARIDIEANQVSLDFFNPRYALSTLCCQTVDEAKQTLWFGSSPLRQDNNQSTRFIAEQSFLNSDGPTAVRVNGFVIYCYKLAEAAEQSPHSLGRIADEFLEQTATLDFASASKLDKDCLTGSLITAYWHYLLSLGEEQRALEVASRVMTYDWKTPYHHFGLNVAVSLLLLALNAHRAKNADELELYFTTLKGVFDKLATKSITNPEWFQDLGGIHRMTLAIWRLHDSLQNQKGYSEWFLKDTVRKSFRVRTDEFFSKVEALYGKPI